jgi:hypothetical protein
MSDAKYPDDTTHCFDCSSLYWELLDECPADSAHPVKHINFELARTAILLERGLLK